MWGTAWERYGSIFAETYTKHWDKSIDLTVVTDKPLDFPRAKQISLKTLPDYEYFTNKWKQMYVKKEGIRPQDGWKYDAMKWMPQAFTPKAVLEANKNWVDGDILVWMDADCEFYADVNESWVEKVLGDAEAATLQRPPIHSEIGFYAIRLSERTRGALYRFADLYLSYDLFDYPEWHSAYAWDIAMEEYGIQIKNLNPTNRCDHVFPESVLAEKINHKKGHRKPGGG